MPHFLTRCLASALAICAATTAADADTFLYRHKPMAIGASSAPTPEPEPEQPPTYDDEQFRNLTFEQEKGSRTAHWGFCGSSAFPTPYYADCDGDGVPNEQFANDGTSTASDTDDQWVATYNSENAAQAYRNVQWAFPSGKHTSSRTATIGPFKLVTNDGGNYGVSVDVLTGTDGPDYRFARVGKVVNGQMEEALSTSRQIDDGGQFYLVFDDNVPFNGSTYRVNLTPANSPFERLKVAYFRMD